MLMTAMCLIFGMAHSLNWYRGGETSGLRLSFEGDAAKLHDLRPLRGLRRDQRAEVRGRSRNRHAAKRRQARSDRRIDKRRVDLGIEAGDDSGRRVFWCADAVPHARLIAGHEVA